MDGNVLGDLLKDHVTRDISFIQPLSFFSTFLFLLLSPLCVKMTPAEGRSDQLSLWWLGWVGDNGKVMWTNSFGSMIFFFFIKKHWFQFRRMILTLATSYGTFPACSSPWVCSRLPRYSPPNKPLTGTCGVPHTVESKLIKSKFIKIK